MNKSIKKKPSHNSLAVNEVAKKYGVTDRYVRAAINGDRTGVIPDKLVAEYKALDKALKNTIQNHQNAVI